MEIFMATIATTAAEAFERYELAFTSNGLVQGAWSSEQDGRHVACALGVLGDKVSSTADCPATVMPRWLAQMVPWLFDNQKSEDAYKWGLEFYAELKRLDGKVPFSVVYDWHANVATVMGIEAAEKRGRDTAPHKALQALHLRALAGDRADRDTWYTALRKADADAYADANAYADADAYAYAYAKADADAYADANAYADADAYAYAKADAYKTAINRLAVGLVECLRRVQA
jgi:hypothetical protein